MEEKNEIRTDIYYGREQTYERGQKQLLNWLGSNENKELIKRYQRYLLARKTGKLRVSKLTYQLRNVCDWLGINLDRVEKNDIERVVAEINQNSKYSVVTQADYRRVIKSFYKWFEDEDKRLEGSPQEIKKARELYKYLQKEISISYKRRNIEYSSLITDDDLQTLLNKGCKSIFEKAIVSILHETGMRVGELLGMRIKDIELKDKHGVIRVDGKTGARPIPISQSIPYIIKWIEDEHPNKENKNSLLWISKNNGHYGKPLRYIGIRKLLMRVFQRANLKKKCNPHFMRHSRATFSARDYREEVLNKMMGWVPGSKMTKTYVHLNSDVVEQEFKRVNGLEEEQEKKVPKTMSCVCGSVNDSHSKYCFKCGKPLKIAVVLEDEQKSNDAISEAIGLLTKIMSNPELKNKFEEYQKNGGKQK